MREANRSHRRTWSVTVRSLFWGLRGQLARSFLLVIIISIGVVWLIAGQAAMLRLDEFAVVAGRRRAFHLAPFLADYYVQTGSWDGVDALISRFNEPLPSELMVARLPWFSTITLALAQDRAVVVGGDGLVVADSFDTSNVGRPISADMAELAVPIYAQDKQVGALVILSGMEHSAAATVQAALRRTVLSAGLLAGALALLVSFALAHRITSRVRNLSLSAQRLASGESYDPLPVQTDDEIGEVTRAFNDMAAALGEQKRLRRQMVADIAHELRTPLSIIRLEVESLEDGMQEPAAAATALRTEVQALERLIEDLRMLSLADAGGLHLVMEQVDVSGFVEQMVGRWRMHAQSRQVRLLTEVEENLPVIQADRERLAQVVSNLLDNALRHTPGGGTITMGAYTRGAEVVLKVSDSGPGIKPQDLARVFDRFYRTDRSRSRDTGGSGLGLAIARHLTLLHGGRIWAESEPDQGAAIFVALPRGEV